MKTTFFLLIIPTLLSIVAVVLYLIWIIDTIRISVPFVNTKRRAILKIVKEFNLKDNDVLYDLGCGSANILTLATKGNPKIKAVGYELSTIPYLIARFNTHNFKNISIKRESLFNADIENATIIYCYLGTNMMKEVEPFILNKCKKGTKVFSTDFKFPNLKPNREIELSTGNRLSKRLYIYEI